MSAEGFLARWSQRKARVRSGVPERDAEASPVDAESAALASRADGTTGGVTGPIGVAPSTGVGAATATPAASAGVGASTPALAPASLGPAAELGTAPIAPTMADVAALTGSSDYARFVVPGVDAGVSNAAMRKLFSDPHFNVMDGLDTYVGDYGKPDPIPLAMLRRMNQSIALGLFADDEERAGELAGAPDAKACPDGAAATPVAQSTAPAPDRAAPACLDRPDDDPDLRLQPDDAARRGGAEPGSRP